MKSALLSSVLVLCLSLAACGREEAVETVAEAAPPAAASTTAAGTEGTDFGAVSAPPAPEPPREVDVRKTSDWPPAELTSGRATVICGGEGPVLRNDPGRGGAAPPSGRRAAGTHDAGQAADRGAQADAADEAAAVALGTRTLTDLEFFSVLDAMSACPQAGQVRLRYEGRIASDFVTLMERVSAMAARMGLDRRVLELDSSGGHVEEALRAGDVIAESGWTIEVKPDDVCHSSCVLVLAAGDDRRIEGAVGIHRMIRIRSQASTRAELNRELRAVHAQMKDYLERNGASVAIADLMMTVPNRQLRLLTADELRGFGLVGRNAAQDDLERIILARKCGEDFVRRKDAFLRAYERRCEGTSDPDGCGLALRARYGFPDRKCPADSPFAGNETALSEREAAQH